MAPSQNPSPPRATNANLSVALARQAVSRRAQERAAASLRRRRAAKPSKPTDSLELLAVVVGAARGPPKFVCPLCASTFGRRCELKRHVAEVHTLDGARRFACNHPMCGKSFTRKDALAKHEIVKHQGKRRFVCPTCSEKFTSRYDLTRHNVRVHSNVKKRFTCEFCAAGFSQKSQLTMHKGRVHSHAKTPTSSPPQSRARTPEPSEHRTSMDSLAAVAVAMAEEEEKKAKRKHLAKEIVDKSLSCNYGPPSHQREAEHGKTPSPAKKKASKEEAEAAAFAADALLEAAAALQPQDAESSFTTNLTDATRMECSTSAEDSDNDHSKPSPCTPSSIGER